MRDNILYRSLVKKKSLKTNSCCLIVHLLLCVCSLSISAQVVTYSDKYEGVPLSDRYKVYLRGEKESLNSIVFKNTCNEYILGAEGNRKNDDKPLTKFAGRTIHWTHFSMKEEVTVELEVAESLMGKEIKILPSRFGIQVIKEGEHKIRFTIEHSGQYSVEIGEEGYKNGLLIFADPLEKEKVKIDSKWQVLERSDKDDINRVSNEKKALYFKSGVHDIGVYKIPENIKEIYLEGGAWVYGAFVMEGEDKSDVKIHGRGVLSGGKLHLRESHSIEAKNGANRIHIDGIVVCDYVFFAIRLLGTDNIVDWTKIVGGWIYNCDGIAAYEGSKIRHCFIWANDDNIKVYRDNIIVEDIVCWQLDNGAIIQLNWSNSKAKNCVVRNVDVIRAEWDSDRENNGIISCRMGGGADDSFLFENINVDTPVTHIFRLSPKEKEHLISNFKLKNWNVKMDMSKLKNNYIEGFSPMSKIKGLIFDDFILNGVKLTKNNFIEEGRFIINNCNPIVFY